MDEHTTKCDTETRRNIEQVTNIVPPNPKEKQGTSLVEFPILLQRETSYGIVMFHFDKKGITED